MVGYTSISFIAINETGGAPYAVRSSSGVLSDLGTLGESIKARFSTLMMSLERAIAARGLRVVVDHSLARDRLQVDRLITAFAP